jgi:hypothetical protein
MTATSNAGMEQDDDSKNRSDPRPYEVCDSPDPKTPWHFDIKLLKPYDLWAAQGWLNPVPGKKIRLDLVAG